jgi:hypothetical protein
LNGIPGLRTKKRSKKNPGGLKSKQILAHFQSKTEMTGYMLIKGVPYGITMSMPTPMSIYDTRLYGRPNVGMEWGGGDFPPTRAI